VNYIFDDLIPDLRAAGVDEATITTIFVTNPADFLTLHN
jgi:phosphotriesterase-related protein